MKVLTNLFHYSVFVPQDEVSKYGKLIKSEFVSENVKVIAQNDQFVVIEDWFFTKLHREKCSYGQYINEKSLSYSSCRILNRGVRFESYSEKKILPATIKKMLSQFIKKEFGAFNNTDLSFIK